MNSQNNHPLSPAQAYYLKALGVDLYGLKDDDAQDYVAKSSDTSNINIPQISSQAPNQVPSQASVQPPSLEEVKRKLQSTANAKGKVQKKPTFLVSELAFKQSQLVADLCVFYEVAEPTMLGDDYFQLGPLQWRFVEQVDRNGQSKFKLADNKLVSEGLAKLSEVATKKALWRAICSDVVQG